MHKQVRNHVKTDLLHGIYLLLDWPIYDVQAQVHVSASVLLALHMSVHSAQQPVRLIGC